MTEKRTSVFENGLIWFGAAVSIAEILTGASLAPLGFEKGLLAILLGHAIGCVLLFLAGMLGAKMRKSAMETVKSSFGKSGSLLFSVLNILQLVGWTAIMIYDGAIAANGIFSAGIWLWALVIGALILLWILIGIRSLGWLNTAAMTALFVLSVVLCFVLFQRGGDIVFSSEESMSFGAALELSVAMPLSWLPLISDYTREAAKPVQSTAVSAVTYGLVSCWMYLVGMGAAIFTGESDIAQIMVKAGLGIAGLLIIVFSTVTTTFLDAYSAGISSESISGKINGKWFAVVVTVVGTLGAILFPITDITDFLYLIGSVFAPMIAIQIADFFLLDTEARKCMRAWGSNAGAWHDASVPQEGTHKSTVNVRNMVIWVIGFIIYRWLMNVDIVIGNTLPDMVITIVICVAADKILKSKS